MAATLNITQARLVNVDGGPLPATQLTLQISVPGVPGVTSVAAAMALPYAADGISVSNTLVPSLVASTKAGPPALAPPAVVAFKLLPGPMTSRSLLPTGVEKVPRGFGPTTEGEFEVGLGYPGKSSVTVKFGAEGLGALPYDCELVISYQVLGSETVPGPGFGFGDGGIQVPKDGLPAEAPKFEEMVPWAEIVYARPVKAKHDSSYPLGSKQNAYPLGGQGDWTAIQTAAVKETPYPREVRLLAGRYDMPSDPTKRLIWLSKGGSASHPFRIVGEAGALISGDSGASTTPQATEFAAEAIRIASQSNGAPVEHVHIENIDFHGTPALGMHANTRHVTCLRLRVSGWGMGRTLNRTADWVGPKPSQGSNNYQTGAFFSGIHSPPSSGFLTIEDCHFENLGQDDWIDPGPWLAAPELNMTSAWYDSTLRRVAPIVARVFAERFLAIQTAGTAVKLAPMLTSVPKDGAWIDLDDMLNTWTLSDVGIPRGTPRIEVVMGLRKWLGKLPLASFGGLSNPEIASLFKLVAAAENDYNYASRLAQMLVATRHKIIETAGTTNSYMKSHALYLGGYCHSVIGCVFRGIGRGWSIKISGHSSWAVLEESQYKPPPEAKQTPWRIEKCAFVANPNPYLRGEANITDLGSSSVPASPVKDGGDIWLAGSVENLHVISNHFIMPPGNILLNASLDTALPTGDNVKIVGNRVLTDRPLEVRIIRPGSGKGWSWEKLSADLGIGPFAPTPEQWAVLHGAPVANAAALKIKWTPSKADTLVKSPFLGIAKYAIDGFVYAGDQSVVDLVVAMLEHLVSKQPNLPSIAFGEKAMKVLLDLVLGSATSTGPATTSKSVGALSLYKDGDNFAYSLSMGKSEKALSLT